MFALFSRGRARPRTERHWSRMLLLSAFTAAPLWQRYRATMRSAREHISQASAITSTRCGPIEFAALGSGTPILVVHGARGRFDQGLVIGRELAPAGFRIIAMSRFGYLRTPLQDEASAPARAARGAEPPSLAREGDQLLVSTLGTRQPQKSVRQDAAFQIRLELVFDKLRYARPGVRHGLRRDGRGTQHGGDGKCEETRACPLRRHVK